MDTEYTPFMRDLEERFKRFTKLPGRSHYKIFYGQVRPAPILTLGINPGGEPSNHNADGLKQKNGRIALASATYFENDEHDVLDCEWPENNGLRKILVPLLNGDARRIRHEVVKTNMAFRRTAKAAQIKREHIAESAPFLTEIIQVVRPKLVLLTGPSLSDFIKGFACNAKIVTEPERDPDVKHIVFYPAIVRLHGLDTDAIAVQVAHASQFSWTYGKHSVVDKIHALMEA